MKIIYLRGLTIMDKLHIRFKSNIKSSTKTLPGWSQHA